MDRRSFVVASALLLTSLGCRDDADSPTEPGMAPQPHMAAAAVLAFWQLSGGSSHTCGVTTDGLAFCWGYNADGQLGAGLDTGPERCPSVGPFTNACSTRPVPVVGGHHFRQVSAGLFHTCGVTTDDRAYCWGSNQAGQLGDGTTSRRVSPVAVAGGRRFRLVDAGYSHTCGVTTDNRALCWGSNGVGQLGDGTTAQRLTPVAVAGGLTFRQVSAGRGFYPFTCGVTTNDRAYCWGRNNYGQLGDSSTVYRRVRPSLVSGGRRYRQLDAGFGHVCAVTTDYRAFCWGNGRYGQLGNGKTYLSFWPRAVRGGLSFHRVTAGEVHTCGETAENRAYCWGNNNSGQLGNGTISQSQTTPAAVAGGLTFKQVSGGGFHTCGKTGASLGYCWGDNPWGQLGDGTLVSRPTPAPVVGPT